MRSLVLSIFLYACESWTLTKDLERRIQATEMRCFRRLLGISYKDRITNEEVINRIHGIIGPYEDLLATVKKRKLFTVTSQGHQDSPKLYCKALYQGKEQEEDRRKDGRTTYANGRVWGWQRQ